MALSGSFARPTKAARMLYGFRRTCGLAVRISLGWWGGGGVPGGGGGGIVLGIRSLTWQLPICREAPGVMLRG